MRRQVRAFLQGQGSCPCRVGCLSASSSPGCLRFLPSRQGRCRFMFFSLSCRQGRLPTASFSCLSPSAACPGHKLSDSCLFGWSARSALQALLQALSPRRLLTHGRGLPPPAGFHAFCHSSQGLPSHNAPSPPPDGSLLCSLPPHNSHAATLASQPCLLMPSTQACPWKAARLPLTGFFSASAFSPGKARPHAASFSAASRAG